MKEIIELNPSEFGLEEKNAFEIEEAFAPRITERKELNKQYIELMKQELTPEICQNFKTLD